MDKLIFLSQKEKGPLKGQWAARIWFAINKLKEGSHAQEAVETLLYSFTKA